jgi:hypothetical protein
LTSPFQNQSQQQNPSQVRKRTRGVPIAPSSPIAADENDENVNVQQDIGVVGNEAYEEDIIEDEFDDLLKLDDEDDNGEDLFGSDMEE